MRDAVLNESRAISVLPSPTSCLPARIHAAKEAGSAEMRTTRSCCGSCTCKVNRTAGHGISLLVEQGDKFCRWRGGVWHVLLYQGLAVNYLVAGLGCGGRREHFLARYHGIICSRGQNRHNEEDPRLGSHFHPVPCSVAMLGSRGCPGRDAGARVNFTPPASRETSMKPLERVALSHRESPHPRDRATCRTSPACACAPGGKRRGYACRAAYDFQAAVHPIHRVAEVWRPVTRLAHTLASRGEEARGDCIPPRPIQQ